MDPKVRIIAAITGILICGTMPAFVQDAWGQDDPAAINPEQLTRQDRDANYSIRPVRVDRAPRIDAIFDEDFWADAPVAGGFIQQRPNFGQPASQPTEIRVVYTRKALYLGVTCYDDNPGAIVHQKLGRDVDIWDDDYLVVVIDTFHDLQNGIFLQINPNGVRRDAAFRNESIGGQVNFDWNGVWKAKTRITDQGWQAEIEMPWRTLRFPTGDEITMGLNFERQRRSVNEQSYWSPVDRQFNSFKVSQAGLMEGLDGIAPGSNIDLRPYGLVTSERGDIDDGAAYADGDWESESQFGYDIKLGLTSNLTADITVNPDFAQIEVDDEQVNLTRFPLFFPEKRQFFLENRDLFAFGSPTNRIFFSRRIGLDPTGRTIPIEYGTRLTGKINRTDIGLIDITTEGLDGTPAERFDVVRLSQDFGTNSRVGGIFTSRTNRDDGSEYNRVYGLDANIRPNDYLDAFAYASMSEENDGGSDDTSWGGRVRYARRLFYGVGTYETYGTDYNPGSGFLPRADVNAVNGELGWTPEPNWGPLRSVETFYFAERIHRRSNGILETRIDWIQSTLTGQGDQTLGVWAYQTYEELFEDFGIGGEVIFPAGRYTFNRIGGTISTDPTRAIFVSAEGDFGDFYDGTLASARATTTLRWAPHLALSGEVEANRVERCIGAGQPKQSYDPDVARIRIRFDLDNHWSLSMFTQWNSSDELLLSQARLRYNFGNESDFYLVFTDGRDDRAGDFAPRKSQLTAKLAYHIRL